MQRCPKCGYREVDWPSILSGVAFGILYISFLLTTDHAPRSLRIVGLFAFFVFLVANSWKGMREKKNRREYLNLPVT